MFVCYNKKYQKESNHSTDKPTLPAAPGAGSPIPGGSKEIQWILWSRLMIESTFQGQVGELQPGPGLTKWPLADRVGHPMWPFSLHLPRPLELSFPHSPLPTPVLGLLPLAEGRYLPGEDAGLSHV